MVTAAGRNVPKTADLFAVTGASLPTGRVARSPPGKPAVRWLQTESPARFCAVRALGPAEALRYGAGHRNKFCTCSSTSCVNAPEKAIRPPRLSVRSGFPRPAGVPPRRFAAAWSAIRWALSLWRLNASRGAGGALGTDRRMPQIIRPGGQASRPGRRPAGSALCSNCRGTEPPAGGTAWAPRPLTPRLTAR
jgi:hypothetical protein